MFQELKTDDDGIVCTTKTERKGGLIDDACMILDSGLRKTMRKDLGSCSGIFNSSAF